MRIFLVRHGHSEGNEDQSKYAEKGDVHIELTDTGWQQAVAAGQFLAAYIQANPGATADDIRLWFSSHMRARQTSAGLIEGTDGLISEDNIRLSSLLTEMDFGLMSHLEDSGDLADHLPFPSQVYETECARNKFNARALMGESPLDVLHRSATVIGSIMRDKDKGHEDVVIVTHGITLRTLAMDFLKIDPKHYDQFDNPENGSIYLIEGDPAQGEKYSFKQIYNGETMQAVDIDWGKKLHIYESYLPEVPERFKLKP